MGISLQDAQQVYSNAGLRTQYGLVLPPGARVAAFVRSTGLQSGDDSFLATNLVPTLAQGLARVRAGLGDFVVCLPGHVENVVDATTFSGSLLAGTKIIGVGRGSNTPTFTWTLGASQWLVNQADVLIAGLRLQFSVNLGANITLPLNVTAADFGFFANEVITSSPTASALTVMALAAGANRADVSGNVFRGTGGLVGIDITGAIADANICDNVMIFPTTTTVGCIRVSAAATGLRVLRNTISNTTAASVAGINYASVASTGQCAYNTIDVLNTGASVSGTTGITIGAACLVRFFQNFICNDPLASGKLLPTVDT